MIPFALYTLSLVFAAAALTGLGMMVRGAWKDLDHRIEPDADEMRAGIDAACRLLLVALAAAGLAHWW